MNLKQELQLALMQSLPLHEIVTKLQDFKAEGGAQAEALQLLEEIRKTALKDGQEDKLLEAMDYVVGFCSSDKAIWNA